jgi:hypothetical protein
MTMKHLFTAAALAVAIGVAVPAAAQNGRDWNGDRGWDRNAFWSDAPSGAWQRIDFLQRRIDRGRADGSLTAREASRAQYQLQDLRRQAWRMRRRDGGDLSSTDEAWLQARLDTLSRQVRWARNNGEVSYRDNRDNLDRFSTSYDAQRYYRDGPQYRERTLGPSDEVYRGSDGRYYCKRNDGTTGLIVGGVGGALLGNAIDGGHNRAAGTLIGGALGAILGKSVDQNSSDVRCR